MQFLFLQKRSYVLPGHLVALSVICSENIRRTPEIKSPRSQSGRAKELLRSEQ